MRIQWDLEALERFKNLDLDAFTVEYERQGSGNKSITLFDIPTELNLRYKIYVSHINHVMCLRH